MAEDAVLRKFLPQNRVETFHGEDIGPTYDLGIVGEDARIDRGEKSC